MNLLLHVCCAPCAIFPATLLQQLDFDVTLFFYNPNIHPYREFQKRLASVQEFAKSHNLSLIAEERYQLAQFLRAVVFRENTRCQVCQELRISKTAIIARENGFKSFSTSLLYSKFQKHDEIRKQCTDYAGHTGIKFIYHDFRQGWKEGVEASISQGFYRQTYCGCIYSEQDRYDKFSRKEKKQCQQ